MSGYFNEPELTRNAFAGGWLKTGDIGYLASGKVHICGRSKEVIIVNGRNYYPQDLEWEAGKASGVRKGNVIAFGTMKPNHDRERVIICFETNLIGEPERAALKGEVRRAVQQALGLTVDDVVPLGVGVLPKTLERQAPALQDPRALRDRRPPRPQLRARRRPRGRRQGAGPEPDRLLSPRRPGDQEGRLSTAPARAPTPEPAPRRRAPRIGVDNQSIQTTPHAGPQEALFPAGQRWHGGC